MDMHRWHHRRAARSPASARQATVLVALPVILLGSTLLTGCGGQDDPIARATDRPLTQSSASPAASGFGSASAAPSVSDSSAPLGSPNPIGAPTPSGVLVQGSGFSFSLPGQPDKTSQSAEAKITFDIYRYEAADATYTVTRGSYPRIGTLPTLNDALKSAAGQAGGKIATSSMLKYKHHPAIEGVITGVTLDGREVSIFARYVVVDRVMYGLLYLDKAADRDMTPAFRAFVESLAFSG
jgi:hypothetical protein